MPPLPAQIVALLLLLGFSAGARAQLDFDLVEVTGTPGPDHPGIDFVFEGTWSFETEAGGVAVADFDADGRLDILLPNTEGHAHHLYLNQGDGSFVASQVIPRCPSKYEMEQRREAGEAMPHAMPPSSSK